MGRAAVKDVGVADARNRKDDGAEAVGRPELQAPVDVEVLVDGPIGGQLELRPLRRGVDAGLHRRADGRTAVAGTSSVHSSCTALNSHTSLKSSPTPGPIPPNT